MSSKKKLNKGGLSDSIKFLGSVKHDTDLPKLYQRCGIFVAPGLSGFTIIEALASGIPIVATKEEWVSEVLTDRKNALLCPPENAKKLAECIGILLEDKKLGSILSKNGRKTAIENFSKEEWKKRELSLYKRATKRNSYNRRNRPPKKVIAY